MFKIMKEEALKYLINLILKCEKTIRTGNNLIPVYYYCNGELQVFFFSLNFKRLVQLRG